MRFELEVRSCRPCIDLVCVKKWVLSLCQTRLAPGKKSGLKWWCYTCGRYALPDKNHCWLQDLGKTLDPTTDKEEPFVDWVCADCGKTFRAAPPAGGKILNQCDECWERDAEIYK